MSKRKCDTNTLAKAEVNIFARLSTILILMNHVPRIHETNKLVKMRKMN